MNTGRNLLKTVTFSFVLLISANSNAWYEGGYHRNGGYYHGGYYNGDYHRDEGYYHGGYYNDGYHVGVGSAVVLPGTIYTAPSCYHQRVCNYNSCWIQQRCY